MVQAVLVVASVVAFVLAGGVEIDGERTARAIPEPDAAWISDFRKHYYHDLSNVPVLSGYRYTNALVALLDDCGAGKEELEYLQRIVPPSMSIPRTPTRIRTISTGEPVFEFVLGRSNAVDVYRVVTCERLGLE